MKSNFLTSLKENIFFTNRYSNTSIELRFFYLICLIGTISSIAGNITSILLELDSWIFYATSIESITCFFAFYIAKKQNSSKIVAWPLIIITFLILSITWFFNAGLEAPNVLFFVLVTMSSTIIVSNSQKPYVLLVSISLFTTCMLLEQEHPTWVLYQQHTAEKKRIDFLVMYIVITSLCFWILNVVIRHHQLAKEKSDKANEAKNKLLSILSHDLRSPFATMTNALRYLSMEDVNISNEERTMLLQKLYQSTHNTAILIDNLLHWTLAQKDGLHLEPTFLNVEEELKQVVNLLESSAQEKRIRIISDYQLNKMIYADTNSLSVVLRNILSNAIKFTNERGTINIHVEQFDNNFAKISVQDSGVGMNAIMLEKLNKQSLISTYGTKNEKGSGLGLQVCYEFLQANKGYLEINSEVGKGSEFVVFLPLN